ncbi:hypothetical protein EMCRGX_G025717 [Ephydatia muelleri]
MHSALLGSTRDENKTVVLMVRIMNEMQQYVPMEMGKVPGLDRTIQVVTPYLIEFAGNQRLQREDKGPKCDLEVLLLNPFKRRPCALYQPHNKLNCTNVAKIRIGYLSTLNSIAEVVFSRAAQFRNCSTRLPDGSPMLVLLIGKAQFVYYVFPVPYLVINVGLAGFRTIAIQFGMDQMVDASGSQMSAFIHWYYWSTYAGSATASVILGCLFSEQTSLVIRAGISVLFMGTALFCWYCLNKWLIKEPNGDNPFKTVYQVCKFSSEHKAPVYRSALTYWDDTKPSRLDLGKSKYGGPFSTEEVEDVKTFFATSMVLVSLGGFILINFTFESLIIHEMKDPKIGKFCTLGSLFTSENLLILIGIPIYEFVLFPVFPVFRNHTPIIVKRIGIGILMDTAAVLSALVLDWYINLENHSQLQTTQCILEHNVTAGSTSSAFIVIPMALDTIAELLVAIAALEFIFAQSPYSMRSMLVGTYYTIQGVFGTMSVLIPITVFYVWRKYQSSWKASCGTVYFSVMAALGIIGFVVYVVVARKYRMRQRDEQFEQYMIVENYYSTEVIQHRQEQS